jgi:hypothetical protein
MLVFGACGGSAADARRFVGTLAGTDSAALVRRKTSFFLVSGAGVDGGAGSSPRPGLDGAAFATGGSA